MPRINTDQPSSGKPIQLFIPRLQSADSGLIPTTWFTLIEAPDFSVPATGDAGAIPDPADADRELRPGEVFIEAPLIVRNTTATARWVEVSVEMRGNFALRISLTPQVLVPAGETVALQIQGYRLLKEPAIAVGDRLQIRAETNDSLTCFGSASELEAQTHAPDSEAP